MVREQNHEFPKFGLLTDPLEFVPDEIIRFRKLGFDYVEIGIEEPNATPRILTRQRDEILRLLSANAMPALGHTAYWVGFGSSHEKARLGWIEEAKDMILVASELKIRLLNFHFYGRLGRVCATEESRNIFLRNFTDAMKDLTEFAATDILTLIPKLSFIRNKKNWGIVFRFGFFEIPKADFETITKKMNMKN